MKWKHTLYTWLCLIPFAALVPVVFSGGWGGDWAFETRFVVACVVLIVMGLWGVFDEKVKALESRLKKLEANEHPATHPNPSKTYTSGGNA